jgi:hypothetical protein
MVNYSILHSDAQKLRRLLPYAISQVESYRLWVIQEKRPHIQTYSESHCITNTQVPKSRDDSVKHLLYALLTLINTVTDGSLMAASNAENESVKDLFQIQIDENTQ